MAREIGLHRLKHYWKLYLFVLPSALLVATFSYYPAVSAIYHSFFRWDGEAISYFIGMRNFNRVLGIPALWIAVLISFFLVLYWAKKEDFRSSLCRYLGGLAFPIAGVIWLITKSAAWDRIKVAGNAELWGITVPKSLVIFLPSLIIWGVLALFVKFLVSSENDRKWFYLLFPILFIIHAALSAIGVTTVFGWLLILSVLGIVLWLMPGSKNWSFIDDARTIQAFVGLTVCAWALGVYAGGDRILWSGFSVIAILVGFNLVKMWPSVITAVVIHRLKGDACTYWYRVLFVIPMIIPGMVALLLWKFFYNPQEGLFNQILIHSKIMDLLILLDGWLGWDGLFREGMMPVWLGHEHLVLPALIMWGFPWVGIVGVLIYLAGLQGISTSVYEAGNLDGANSIQKFLHIELPLILTQIRINMILMIIGTLKTYAFIMILFGIDGGPNGRLMVPGLYMFRTAFRESSAGYACAIGLVIFFFILILTEINNKYVRVQK